MWPFKTSEDNGGPFATYGYEPRLRAAWPQILASEANGTLAVQCSLHAATSGLDVFKIVGEVAIVVGAAIVAAVGAVAGGHAALDKAGCGWSDPKVTTEGGGINIMWTCKIK